MTVRSVLVGLAATERTQASHGFVYVQRESCGMCQEEWEFRDSSLTFSGHGISRGSFDVAQLLGLHSLSPLQWHELFS